MLLRLGAVSILAGSLFAASFSFTGSFTTDDQVDTFAISVAAAGPVVVRTLSFGGGVNANGDAIPAGGFDPVLGLYETTGLNQMIATGDKGVAPAGCGPRGIDPATGACWDVVIDTVLNPGNYILTLSQYDNVPPFFYGDPFPRAGDPRFTGPAFAGDPNAMFVALGGFQRTGSWALDITGVDAAVLTPEPAAFVLVGLGLGGIAFRRLRGDAVESV